MKIRFLPYKRTIQRIEIQFELLRFSLEMSHSKQDAFRKKFLNKEMSRFDSAWEKIKDMQARFPGTTAIENLFDVDDLRKNKEKQLKHALKSSEKKIERVRNIWTELTEATINQSEFVLLVAHFEAFMDIILEKLLQVCPAKIDVEKLKWKDKVSYFETQHGIQFGNFKSLKDLRNDIMHRIYQLPEKSPNLLIEPEKVNSMPMVTNNDLEMARRDVLAIPSECVKSAGRKFQSYFQWP
jgi:hypothetical protein